LTTPASSIALVLSGSVIGSIGAALLKAGAHHLGKSISSILLNWRLALGIVTYLVSSVFFVKGIAHGELSILFPMVSLSYIGALIWSRLFFHEQLTKPKLAGVALILVGIVFLGLGNR
jgi:drug/metabolite transporter (DMT)-like permease